MSFSSAMVHGCSAVTSFFFNIYYLVTLFIVAFSVNVIGKQTPKDESVQLTKEEKRLVFDLGYYLRLQNMDIKKYSITTPDGHILKVNRVINKNADRDAEKPGYPILLIPGLMQSSSAYCTSGPNAIGVVLARMGYDVWLGNNRGGFHPEKIGSHQYSTSMWKWSMQDLATKDVPTMVHFVASETGAKKVAIAAHSQGTTQTFIGLSREEHGGVPTLCEKVSSFSALAPAVYAGPLVDRWFLKMLRVGRKAYHTLVGYRSFLGFMSTMRQMLPNKFFGYCAYITFNYMLGWDDSLWDNHYRNRNFIFAPVMVSADLMFWWLGKGGFADRKCIFESEGSKWFDENFPPLQLYACGRDNLVLPDVLINRIMNFEPDVKDGMEVISLPHYSHLDVMWANDACTKVAMPLGEFIWDKVEDKHTWRQPNLDAGIKK